MNTSTLPNYSQPFTSIDKSKVDYNTVEDLTIIKNNILVNDLIKLTKERDMLLQSLYNIITSNKPHNPMLLQSQF